MPTPEERAYAAADLTVRSGSETRRHLSLLRVFAVVAALAALAGGVVAWRAGDSARARAAVPVSSFSPYVDVTATPLYAFENVATSMTRNVVLGFVVGDPKSRCTPSWGGAYSLDQAGAQLDLDRRVARFQQRGGAATVSFGGEANTELATDCTDPTELAAAYAGVVHRYHLDTVDLDIEGSAASAPAATARRAAAIHAVQQRQARAGRPLQVWLTLPVDPRGLTAQGRQILRGTLAGGVDVAGVNGMTMDYGASLSAGESLTAANESALTHLAGQLASAFTAAGHPMTSGDAWQHVGATPMIGQNDVTAERFQLADARSLVRFATTHHVRRLSMWSLNRDQACGPNYANVSVVSDACSGVTQRTDGFAAVFAAFRQKGRAVAAATSSTATSPSAGSTATSVRDDPATSPYPIWNPALPYPAGTKIVWHRNVYQAKWWSEGDTPDAPVTSAYQTPWVLIGPVLPGEHPQPTPTLSTGTYPQWSASAVYRAGARVIYHGIGYQAKWYTAGAVPGVVVSDPGDTPWEPITSK